MPDWICEICPREPRASLCLADGRAIWECGEDEPDLTDCLDCVASGDAEPAIRYVLGTYDVAFRIVAQNAAGEYENRDATPEEMRATCEAIYFESETDFSDVDNCRMYLLWQAAADVQYDYESKDMD